MISSQSSSRMRRGHQLLTLHLITIRSGPSTWWLNTCVSTKTSSFTHTFSRKTLLTSSIKASKCTTCSSHKLWTITLILMSGQLPVIMTILSWNHSVVLYSLLDMTSRTSSQSFNKNTSKWKNIKIRRKRAMMKNSKVVQIHFLVLLEVQLEVQLVHLVMLLELSLIFQLVMMRRKRGFTRSNIPWISYHLWTMVAKTTWWKQLSDLKRTLFLLPKLWVTWLTTNGKHMHSEDIWLVHSSIWYTFLVCWRTSNIPFWLFQPMMPLEKSKCQTAL